MGFDKFLKDLDKETSDILKDTNSKIKNTGKVINDSLMGPKSEVGTPVITKHLRNNWIITIDQEYFDVSGSRENPNDSKQQEKYQEFINSEDLYLSDNIYWNNNVYYGPLVNYGVGQPEQLFREKAIQRGEAHLINSRK